MGKIIINQAGCKGCAYCVLACPRELIIIDQSKINNLGYNPAVFRDNKDNRDAECTGCALCAEICPEVLIEVYREKRRAGDCS